jgi:hypothetical protein
MDTGILIWFIIFVVSAAFFFGTAIVITFKGTKDLKDLLLGSTKKK